MLVISLAFVPIAFAALASLFHRDFHVGVGAVAKVVLGRALIPLLLGLGAARLVPRFAAKAGPVLMKIINIALFARPRARSRRDRRNISSRWAGSAGSSSRRRRWGP